MSLDLSRPVRTRDGREVKQLTVFDAKSEYTIHGVVDDHVERWTRGGEYVSGSGIRHDCDLVNVPERVKRTVFLRVGDYGPGRQVHSTKPPPRDGFYGYIRVDIDAEIIPFD